LPIINSGAIHDLNRRLGRTIRAHRLAQRSSLGDLARVSGLSKTILGRIESGEGNPSLETLWRISQALHLPLGSLLEDEDRPHARVIPARSGERIRAESGMVGWLVHADGREHRSELYDLDYPAGTEHRSAPHLPGTEELLVCVHGRLVAGPEGEEADLGPGDALLFAADAPHVYRASRDSRVLCWMLYANAT
jgi:XRE family transcriptional regulator, regulator of sulfur utilization